MKNIKPCDEVCHECGFLNDSQPGLLKEELGIIEMIREGQVFPCHMQLEAVTGSMNTGVEKYIEKKDTFKVCRGYVESMFISEMHLNVPFWQDLYEKLDGKLNSKTMTILQALQYHKQKPRVP